MMPSPKFDGHPQAVLAGSGMRHVDAAVPGRRDDGRARADRVPDRVLDELDRIRVGLVATAEVVERIRAAGGALVDCEARIGHVDVLDRDVLEGAGRSLGGDRTARAGDLDDHELDVGTNADDADAVISCRDDPGDLGAMADVVGPERARRIGDRLARQAGDAVRRVDASGELRVRSDAGVDQRHSYERASARDRLRLERVNPLHVPLLAGASIGRRRAIREISRRPARARSTRQRQRENRNHNEHPCRKSR
jgi:hypothetical protein